MRLEATKYKKRLDNALLQLNRDVNHERGKYEPLFGLAFAMNFLNVDNRRE